MPFKSEAQRRKFMELQAQGKIKPAVVKEFSDASVGLKLPERVVPKPAGRQQFASVVKKAKVIK